jgi:hypothetical protein
MVYIQVGRGNGLERGEGGGGGGGECVGDDKTKSLLHLY